MNIPVIVLAAGSSQRMGRAKPLLEFGDRTCLSLVLSACLSSRATETVLVLGAEASRVRGAIGAPGDGLPDGRLSVAVNDQHGRGQTSSLKIGLELLPGGMDAFLVFPVDHPLVTSADLDALIDRFEPRRRGRTIFIASHEGTRGHPALFAAHHRGPILELGDDEPLHNYIRIREGEIETVDRDSPGVTMPMNTPEEYERVLNAWRARVAAAGENG